MRVLQARQEITRLAKRSNRVGYNSVVEIQIIYMTVHCGRLRYQLCLYMCAKSGQANPNTPDKRFYRIVHARSSTMQN